MKWRRKDSMEIGLEKKYSTERTKKIPFICLDAGHYGNYNQSPAVPEYYEAQAMWKLHLLQKKYLEEYGFKVITTRENQESDLALQQRGQKAKGCVLFLSNHSNAVGGYVNEAVDYVATYHLTEDVNTVCDDISKEIAGELAPVIAQQMGVSQGHRIVARKSENDRNGDGLMNDNYYGVLHGARSVDVPGLILEHSFHTNTKSTKWLMNEKNLDKLARAEAEVIAKYFHMEKVVLESEPEMYYCVQVGAYTSEENAKRQLQKVRDAGFDAFIAIKKANC